MTTTYGSVCSGIEAATVAWHPLGWRAAWLSEIEPFPCAVLAHHYPQAPNLGDMTTIADRILSGEVEAPDVFTGGTPCQAFSVAGLRKGLNDDRGQLSLEFCRIAGAIDTVRQSRGLPPSVIMWENVPGVLSDKSNAFGCFLAGLAGEALPLEPPGGKWSNAGCVLGPQRTVAWRVLDAQYFGVAQRRRRVWVVASARNDLNPCEILFESEGVRRDSAPSRETGQKTSGDVEGCAGVSGFDRYNQALTGDVSCTVRLPLGGDNLPHVLTATTTNGSDLAPCLDANMDKKWGSNQWFSSGMGILEPVAFHAEAQVDQLPTEARDTSISDSLTVSQHAAVAMAEPLQLQGIGVQYSYASTQETDPRTLLPALREAIGEKAFAEWGLGILVSFLPQEVLRKAVHGLGLRCQTIEEFGLVNYALSCPQDRSERAVLQVWGREREGCPSPEWGPHGQRAKQLSSYLSLMSQPGASADTVMRDLWQAAEGPGVLREALSAVQKVWRPIDDQSEPTHRGFQVRRLTVVECEFLMGFPRNYTKIPWKNKPAADCPDGPRYKALGNSWAVPCAAWIGKRIDERIN